jgi:pimeloyl-ACP methyl ester carboxylesterase
MPDKSYPIASLQVIGPANSEAALLDVARRIASLKSLGPHLARAKSVESSYAPLGPYATQTGAVQIGAVTYKLYYPKRYADLGFQSPIITWGNGTWGHADNYSNLLTHFASYGFTVVAADLQNTGSGNDIGVAARYMVSQNAVAGSPFAGHLDVSHVAAVGHSQGAAGAANAALKNPGVITAVMTFSLPDARWASSNSDCPSAAACTPDISKLTQPVFFISTRGF